MTTVINSFSILHFVCSFCSLFVVGRVCIHESVAFILTATTLYYYAFAFIQALVSTEFPYPIPHMPCHAIYALYYTQHTTYTCFKSIEKYGFCCCWLRLKWIHVHRLKSGKFENFQMKLTLFWWPEYSSQCKQANPYYILFLTAKDHL